MNKPLDFSNIDKLSCVCFLCILQCEIIFKIELDESICNGFCKMSVDYGLFLPIKYNPEPLDEKRNQGRFGRRSFRPGHHFG